jgi:hypothetical protein
VTREKHRQVHIELHQSLDRLVADYLRHTGRCPSEVSVMDLMAWSHSQTLNPTEFGVLN